MGMHFSVSVGPYVEVVTKPRAVVETIRACTNTTCMEFRKESRTKHCPDCGTAIGSVEVERTKARSVYDVIDEDSLSPVGEMRRTVGTEYLVPNTKGPREFRFSDESATIDMTDLDRAAEVAWLEKRAAVSLAKLREAFADVRVRWGVLGYWS